MEMVIVFFCSSEPEYDRNPTKRSEPKERRIPLNLSEPFDERNPL
jgi:hypothetical protein